MRRIQKGILQFSLCNNSLKAVKAGLISPKLHMRTLRDYKAHLGPRAASSHPSPALFLTKLAGTESLAGWATEDVQRGSSSCVGKRNKILTQKSLGLYLAGFYGTKFALLILWQMKTSHGHSRLQRSEMFKWGWTQHEEIKLQGQAELRWCLGWEDCLFCLLSHLWKWLVTLNSFLSS